jgi:Asp-tRNA(Asn)/Glu-tRNA(Gln) amidotransferase A subunit family amidase
MTDLHYLTAAEALRLFGKRELSLVELVAAVIERAEAVEPVVNAFAETFYEQALRQVQAAAARYAAGQPWPFDELPVAVKEEAEIAALRPIGLEPMSAQAVMETRPANLGAAMCETGHLTR